MIANNFLRTKDAFVQHGYLLSLLLICVTFFSPFQLVLNISIILLALVWIIEGKFKEKFKNLASSPVALLYISLFLLYLIGVYFTDDFKNGIKSLETKASLLVFPLIIGSATIKKQHYNRTLLFFSIACAAFSLMALLYQITIAIDTNDINYIFNDGLVYSMKKKAVVYAMYVAFSILIMMNYLWASYPSLKPLKKILLVVAIAFLFVILFLLATRASMLVLLLIVAVTLAVIGVRKRKFKLTALVFLSLTSLFVTLSLLFPQTISRFESLKNIEYDFANKSGIYHFSEEVNEKDWNGINLRLAKWVCALDVVKQYPLTGVGTGDVKDEMVNAYRNRNFQFAVEKRFDPHNQYLDTAVSIGLIGLLVLLGCYFYPLYCAIQRKSWLFTSFMILIIFSSITESILSSAQSIIFLCFFVFVLLKGTPTQKLVSDLHAEARPV